MITITLDAVIKRRGKSEWREVNKASLSFLLPDGSLFQTERVGDGALIKALLADFHEKYPRINAQVEVLRGDTPVFVRCPVFQWLGMDGEGNKMDKRPEHLKRHNTQEE